MILTKTTKILYSQSGPERAASVACKMEILILYHGASGNAAGSLLNNRNCYCSMLGRNVKFDLLTIGSRSKDRNPLPHLSLVLLICTDPYLIFHIIFYLSREKKKGFT